VIDTINNGNDSSLAFGGIYGLSKSFPNLTTWFQEHLLPEKAEEFHEIANACYEGSAHLGKNKDVYSYFRGGRPAFQKPVPQSVTKWSGTMGGWGTPKVPLYIYKSVGDEVSPEADTQALVNRYCAGGATVEYQRDLVGSHATEAIVGSPNALEWLSDRLSGDPVSHQGYCRTDNVTYWELSPKSIALFGRELHSLLQILLGGRLGARR
jgi:hypothetical protein